MCIRDRLNHLNEGKQGKYEVVNSMLSEEAVLGFEYGYSLAEPSALTLWEAQFGDFANGAQVLFDQFISSGERKWLRMSGLVCLLPHGYEGQGPEHSSARLERFLQLCAEDNMQVANVTTPANYFHILRRQLKRDFRKPLILMTPKSLLRHKRAVSTISELSGESAFHRLLWDDAQLLADQPIKLVRDSKIRRVVMSSGKVYYDLYEAREAAGIDDVYIMRVEQLYPFPARALMTELARFANADVVWAQEEPRNMGAWFFVEPALEWGWESFDDYLLEWGMTTAANVAPLVGHLALRIAVNGEIASEQEISELVEWIRPTLGTAPGTTFEAITAIAFEHFRRRDVQVAVQFWRSSMDQLAARQGGGHLVGDALERDRLVGHADDAPVAPRGENRVPGRDTPLEFAIDPSDAAAAVTTSATSTASTRRSPSGSS